MDSARLIDFELCAAAKSRKIFLSAVALGTVRVRFVQHFHREDTQELALDNQRTFQALPNRGARL